MIKSSCSSFDSLQCDDTLLVDTLFLFSFIEFSSLLCDEKKRLEYETRQRAIRDYNIGMLTAERRGIEAGRKIGRQEGREEGETLGVSRINQLILELSKHGRTDDIVKAAADKEYQEKLLKEFDL